MNGRIGIAGLALVAALQVAGCGSAGSPSPSSMPSEVAPLIVTGASPGAATASPDAADEAAIAYAISQRKQFGLRSDEAWVRRVAADPRASISMLDFPMLPEEEAEFQARQDSYQAVVAAVNRYAAGQEREFGGVWIDQVGHTVVAAWTANPALHRLGIIAGPGGPGPLEVRFVRYSEKELRDLQDRISADWDWMHKIDAAPMGVGADLMANVTDLEISSTNPQAPALIVAHYGVPADMLRVSSDGTGIRLLERGAIRGTVLHADGSAPPPDAILEVRWQPDRPGPGSGDCGVGDMGYGVGRGGTFELPCAPGGWTITLMDENGDSAPVGSGHVVVPPGETVELKITLAPGTKLSP